MLTIKRIILLLSIFLLVGCQSRFGEIEILNRLKVSDISGIYIKTNKNIKFYGYLTENDETSIIKELKKIKVEDLEKANYDTTNFDYSITIETNDISYEVLMFYPNKLCINGINYKINESIVTKISNILDGASYLKRL